MLRKLWNRIFGKKPLHTLDEIVTMGGPKRPLSLDDLKTLYVDLVFKLRADEVAYREKHNAAHDRSDKREEEEKRHRDDWYLWQKQWHSTAMPSTYLSLIASAMNALIYRGEIDVKICAERSVAYAEAVVAEAKSKGIVKE